jgi:hypothetical protein
MPCQAKVFSTSSSKQFFSTQTFKVNSIHPDLSDSDIKYEPNPPWLSPFLLTFMQTYVSFLITLQSHIFSFLRMMMIVVILIMISPLQSS